ncbi:MAG: hypothetical protein HYT20_00125 [Candidatus Nealsonbacteria bacterium]|nr:hypothetical protein [Candidatus Nealsonbacteria bacterium]
MKKTILISLGFLFLISALMAVTIWRAPNLPASKSLQDVLPKEFRETFPTMKTSEPKKFISPDGKFQIEYPGDWVTTNQEELLGNSHCRDFKKNGGGKQK